MKIIELILSLLAKLAAPMLAFFAGKNHAEEKEAIEDAKAFESDAHHWAGAPFTDIDFERRLRARIIDKGGETTDER